MMPFLRNYWVPLVCGVVMAGSIAVLVLGMMDDSVTTEMKKRLQVARDIDALRNNAKNEATISTEKERTRAFKEEYDATLQVAEEICRREPLLSGVFPKFDGTDDAFRFQETYITKLFELPRKLMADGPPSEQEIDEEAERIAEEVRRREGAGEGTGILPGPATTPGGGTAPPRAGGGAATPGGPGRGPGGATPGYGGGRRPTPGYGRGPGAGYGGGAPGGGSQQTVDTSEAAGRAAVRKARNIRLYAEVAPFEESAFHVSPIARAETAPTAREMWYAQVSYWVQLDVVNAIREVNEAAAARLSEDEVHVANMPVKRIVQVDVHGYVRSDGQLVAFPTVSRSGTAAAHQAPTSFTGRVSDEQFDVVRFSAVVVADQQDLLKLVDAITRENFYQLIDIDYEAVPPGGREGPYFYGGEPAVRATLVFEGYLARRVYKGMMPADVLADLGITGDGS